MDQLLAKKDLVLHEGNVGLLCNQTSFSFSRGKYLFEILNERGVLKKIFVPEHGFFAELQDQITLDNTVRYKQLAKNVSFFSLYQFDKQNSVEVPVDQLIGLNALIVDLQDIGSRYYTYLSTIKFIFGVISKNQLPIKIYLLDRPNPAGRQVEGSMLPSEFASFIGIQNLPHRHGLTIGELSVYFNALYDQQVQLEIIYQENTKAPLLPVFPSPNIPDIETCYLYSGQCLFEGTILSEGRGTTKPFQIFGAPFLDWSDLTRIKNLLEQQIKPHRVLRDGAILRPLFFLPKFHKWTDQICGGFQLHLTGKPVHVLLFSLLMIRIINEIKVDLLLWREGEYEFGNSKKAIELLAGDYQLLNFLYGYCDFTEVIDYLREAENKWLNEVNKYQKGPDEIFSLL